jgi:hypothetical protein
MDLSVVESGDPSVGRRPGDAEHPAIRSGHHPRAGQGRIRAFDEMSPGRPWANGSLEDLRLLAGRPTE